MQLYNLKFYCGYFCFVSVKFRYFWHIVSFIAMAMVLQSRCCSVILSWMRHYRCSLLLFDHLTPNFFLNSRMVKPMIEMIVEVFLLLLLLQYASWQCKQMTDYAKIPGALTSEMFGVIPFRNRIFVSFFHKAEKMDKFYESCATVK